MQLNGSSEQKFSKSALNLANGIHWQTDHFKYEHI